MIDRLTSPLGGADVLLQNHQPCFSQANIANAKKIERNLSAKDRGAAFERLPSEMGETDARVSFAALCR